MSEAPAGPAEKFCSMLKDAIANPDVDHKELANGLYHAYQQLPEKTKSEASQSFLADHSMLLVVDTKENRTAILEDMYARRCRRE